MTKASPERNASAPVRGCDGTCVRRCAGDRDQIVQLIATSECTRTLFRGIARIHNGKGFARATRIQRRVWRVDIIKYTAPAARSAWVGTKIRLCKDYGTRRTRMQC
jgi:hypothetical protein